MASSLSINSLIAQLSPGFIPPSSRQAAPIPVGTAPESGAVFVRQQVPPGSEHDQPRLVYTRKDARGARENSASANESARLGQVGATDDASVDDSGAESTSVAPSDSIKKPNGELLSKAEMAVLRELQKADQAVRTHEIAHLAAAGGYARGGATFSFQRGPDGQNYAVGGEVSIDTGKEASPEATIAKMQIVRQAALAPADPSPQDQRVASYATLQISEASKELFTTRSSTEAQSQSPKNPQTHDETPRDIYQRAGQDLGRQGNDDSAASSSKKAYSAYFSPKNPPVENDRSVVDRMV